jgi:hypothetical protein
VPVLTIAALLIVEGTQSVASDVSPYELQALAARRAVQRGIINLDATYQIFDLSTGKCRAERPVRAKVFFNGSRIRKDEHRDYDAGRSQTNGTTYRVVRCFGDDEYIEYSNEVSPDGKEFALNVRPVNSVSGEQNGRVDPRLIGMVTNSFLNLAHHTLEAVIGRPDRRETSVEGIEVDGALCQLVKYVRNDGAIARIWICPNKGFSVVKLQVKDDTYEDTVECSVVKDIPSGIWFPDSYVFTRLTNGQLHERERCTVKVLSLNGTLPEDTFTLAGIGVPVGKRVHFYGMRGGRTEIWDGKHVVPLEGGVANSAAERPRKRIVFIATSLIAIIIMIGALMYRHRAGLK